MLIQFVQQSEQLVEVRGQSLCAAVHIVCELKAVQYFSTLLHSISTLTRHCNLDEDLGARLSTPGVRGSLKVLAALHPSGRAVIKDLRDCLTSSYERNASVYAVSSTLLPQRSSSFTSSGGGTGTNYMHSVSPEDLPDERGPRPRRRTRCRPSPPGSPQEIALLMKHIEWGLRVKEDKLREWFAELQKLIILVSPNPPSA
ncbi:hypothetical protein STCU_11909 [Strigomonas culicis]|uniref:Uncharacterized protein n=1 Tax=Strigomonas culicis TaxID=28005 RepID=S9TC77_9TRYP|nr:hypothetical protein STCU_11909 [Strigomonas culicis]|eukprot:EPY15587.1 hypothetical protein STCU_11909 [Strigomonas culicis]